MRSRLSEAVTALRAPGEAADGDDLLALVAGSDRERRLARLEQALVDFDAATITTIHGFAQQVLRTLGSAACGDLDASLLDNTPELLGSVCADVLAAESFADETASADLLPSLKELSEIAAKVLANPGIRLIPEADAETSPPVARLRHLVDLVVDGIHHRRRSAGTLSFDDLLTQLRDALGSEAATAILRRRFQVALIDEFQDTDPVQWAIFSKMFANAGEGSSLVLVADPKQAIYAFRGANVHTYLEAAHEQGTERSTLRTNWRSDGALLSALELVFSGATFGDPKIGFVPVKASEQNERLRMTSGGENLPALRLRLALGEDLPRTAPGPIQVDAAQAAIARDLALQVHELLDSARLPARGDKPERALRPKDIAVLVGQHNESEIIQAALRKRGIPAVTTRGDSVLRSPAATQWRWLLNALARPSDPTRARSAALSWFFGWSVAYLDSADDLALSEVQNQLDSWSKTLATQGAVALCARIWSENGITARVLAASDGDRNLTDLGHIASLVQAAAIGRRPTPAGLLSLLDQLEGEISDDPENDVTARQVESDAEAVQIMTVYVAKGLEFPVVCVPTMWRSSHAIAHEVIYQDPVTGWRTFDIANGAEWPTAAEAADRKALADAEALGESLRLLYVALTRAEHQTLLWWTRGYKSELTGLARLLFARKDGEIDAELFAGEHLTLPADCEAGPGLQAAFAPAGDAVAVTVTGAADQPVRGWTETSPARPESRLELSVLHNPPDRAYRRWSFSAMTARARETGAEASDESAESAGFDEPVEEVLPAEALPARTSAVASDLPLGTVPGGVQFGTLVHEVLERVDFAAVDLEAELKTSIEDKLRWNPWPVETATLLSGLKAVIETPLGPPFGTRRLRDLPRQDRLNELSFELCLANRQRRPTDRDIGAVVLGHVQGDDPLRSWAEQLCSAQASAELAGHLTGSIDMVVRVPAEEGARRASRFVVVDYKTNVLAEANCLPQESDYHPDRLAVAMAEHHYPLQALLYSVALHRYLRWRVADYDPARHLGGVAYLFVRGMAGAATPLAGACPYGVFHWRVPPGLVGDLSDLLDGAEVSR